MDDSFYVVCRRMLRTFKRQFIQKRKLLKSEGITTAATISEDLKAVLKEVLLRTRPLRGNARREGSGHIGNGEQTRPMIKKAHLLKQGHP